MFTGIVEEVGIITSVRHGTHSSVLGIQGRLIFSDLKIGDSIAVNGVCLTVTSTTSNIVTADVMHETLDRSSLGAAAPGMAVNLERAMPADGRFGGHIVTGHIDGIGKIIKIKKDDNAVWYTISADPEVMRYIIPKGSVAVDGISLTVAALSKFDFQVSIIPHTVGQTVLGGKRQGDLVNLENDMIGKYVERLLASPPPGGGKGSITMDFLSKNGF